jgi:thioredoxin reductase (NADPH)
VAQRIKPINELAKQLKVDLDKHGFIITDSEQITNIEGVFAAGDITRLHNHQVSSAVHEGGMAAAAANYYLYEDWQKE